MINTDNIDLRTDLVIEKNVNNRHDEVYSENDVTVTTTVVGENKYSTISFLDITDKDSYASVLKVFVKELKKYIKVTPDDVFLVVGLGNSNSTPDALGPESLDNILVTRHLFMLGGVEDGYSNVAIFKPSVMGETGIETVGVLKSIIKESGCTKVIMIDALKASKVSRLNKVIQITNSGINPGSGINNDRGEVSKKTMGVEVIAIGVPTVVDVLTIIEDIIKESATIKENLIVTPTSIDFLIKKMGCLIGNGINIVLHKDFIRQNNSL